MKKKMVTIATFGFRALLSLLILYAFFIFYLSSQSNLQDARSFFNFLDIRMLKNIIDHLEDSQLNFLLFPLYLFSKYPDKIVHAVLYAGFGFLLYYTLRKSSNFALSNHALLFSIIIGIAYAASDEFHQSFVPGRTASILDLLADAIGILMSQIMIFCISIIKKRKLKNENYGKINTFDLFVIMILIVLSFIFILVPPFNETIIRILLALPFLLFLPGYLFIAVMFPKRGELSAIERFTLSIGLSIAITVFDGFALNYTKWGFRPNSIVVSLSLIMGILLIIAFFLRLRLQDSGYSFSLNDVISFYRTIKSEKLDTGQDYDPDLEKMLIKTMIISILIVSVMLIYAKVTTEPEKFTTLYILGNNGKAENYPSEIRIGEVFKILVGIENYEYKEVHYTLRIKLGESIVKEEEIIIDHEEKWLKNVTFFPQLTSSVAFAETTPIKLEFQLMKDNLSYRSVHLLVRANLDHVKFSDIPYVINGEMETDKGWFFSKKNSSNSSGRYNFTTNSSSRVLRIDFYGDSADSYGTMFQNVSTQGNARSMLSFDIKDSGENVSSNIFKQALLDEKIIWNSSIGGLNDSWEHIEIPLLLSGNNTLSFRVYSKYGAGNATIWLDNVQLKPLSSESKIKPAPKEYEFNFNVRGEPILIDKSITIDGFKFQGFKYDLNKNISYEELKLTLSENNTIESGNATYITRISGNDINLMGMPFRIITKNTSNENFSIIISRSDIPFDKTLTLGKTMSIGEYSFTVKLISSKFDSAIIELKKSGQIVNTQTVSVGNNYDYSVLIGNNWTKVFGSKIYSIDNDNVYLIDILLYSEFITLKPGEIYGNFEITDATSQQLVFKNIYPVEFKDNISILNGNLGLKISGDNIYLYSRGTSLRGTPQYMTRNKWMNITGFNFPGFYLEDDISYEELDMYFSRDGFVEKGDALYLTRVHTNKLSFLGKTYELVYPDRPGYLSDITAGHTLTIHENENQTLNGYIFSYIYITDETIKLMIKKSPSKYEEDLLKHALGSNVSFFPDIRYEIYKEKDNNFIKTNIINIGDSFEYREESEIDRMYKKIGGELTGSENNSIELSLKFYDIPFEVYPGKTYKDFDVYSINNDSIILKNNKPLLFEKGNETAIMDDTLKLKTSSIEFLAYPIK